MNMLLNSMKQASNFTHTENGAITHKTTFMVENKLTGCKISTIKQHISEVCKGRRKTAAKYIWRFSDTII